MNSMTIVLLLIMVPLLSFGQGFSLNNLEEMTELTWSQLNNKLGNSGWNLQSSNYQINQSLILWSNENDGTDLTFRSNTNGAQKIEYSINKETYLKIIKSIEERGYNEISSEIGNNELRTYYNNGSFWLGIVQNTGIRGAYYQIIVGKQDVRWGNLDIVGAAEKQSQEEENARLRAQNATDLFVRKTHNVGGSGNRFDLAGRTIVGALPRPAYTVNEQGTVVVNVVVNSEGDVVEATVFKTKGITSKVLKDAAVSAAYKAKFDYKKGPNQRGTITYEFKLN